MAASVLQLAASIYAPFDHGETRRLREYVHDVESLVASRFFQQGDQTLTLSAEAGGPLQSRLSGPDDEAVRAVVGLFRQIYNHHEPTSYHQILKLLGEHVHRGDSEHRDAASADLKALRAWETDALQPTVALRWRHVLPDSTIDEEELTPAVLIDLFLHGHYLHKGNEKSDKLAAWPLADLALHSFFGAMVALSRVYWVGRNVVAEALKVPSLLDATSAP